MIQQNIKYHDETPVVTTTGKRNFTARQIFTMIKKAKRKGFQLDVYVGTQYNKKPMGKITGFVTPPKDGISVWNDEPSIIKVTGSNTNHEYTYRVSELVIYKPNKTTGELEPSC